ARAFLNDTSAAVLLTLSLHDALPIYHPPPPGAVHGLRDRPDGTLQRELLAHPAAVAGQVGGDDLDTGQQPHVGVPLPAVHPRAVDRKSTRLNSSHVKISYAVFCLKKK